MPGNVACHTNGALRFNGSIRRDFHISKNGWRAVERSAGSVSEWQMIESFRKLFVLRRGSGIYTKEKWHGNQRGGKIWGTRRFQPWGWSFSPPSSFLQAYRSESWWQVKGSGTSFTQSFFSSGTWQPGALWNQGKWTWNRNSEKRVFPYRAGGDGKGWEWERSGKFRPEGDTGLMATSAPALAGSP